MQLAMHLWHERLCGLKECGQARGEVCTGASRCRDSVGIACGAPQRRAAGLHALGGLLLIFGTPLLAAVQADADPRVSPPPQAVPFSGSCCSLSSYFVLLGRSRGVLFHRESLSQGHDIMFSRGRSLVEAAERHRDDGRVSPASISGCPRKGRVSLRPPSITVCPSAMPARMPCL